MNRRTKPRLNSNLDALWQDQRPAKITNLSAGGCYLDTVGEVQEGEVVGFRVLLPDDDWLYLEGEVRHHSVGSGFGVRFVDLNEEQAEKLQWLLRIVAESGPDEQLSGDLVEE
ncbi:MAG: PilZ domain-containing protein [Pyrinomonadaceae bacterium]